MRQFWICFLTSILKKSKKISRNHDLTHILTHKRGQFAISEIKPSSILNPHYFSGKMVGALHSISRVHLCPKNSANHRKERTIRFLEIIAIANLNHKILGNIKLSLENIWNVFGDTTGSNAE